MNRRVGAIEAIISQFKGTIAARPMKELNRHNAPCEKKRWQDFQFRRTKVKSPVSSYVSKINMPFGKLTVYRLTVLRYTNLYYSKNERGVAYVGVTGIF